MLKVGIDEVVTPSRRRIQNRRACLWLFDGHLQAAAAFQPIRANVHEVRKMVLAGSRVHGSRMRRTRGEGDIPHRLVTNNRKVEISYPALCLSRNTQPVDVIILTDGEAIWHAKCVGDRLSPGLQCCCGWPMTFEYGEN